MNNFVLNFDVTDVQMTLNLFMINDTPSPELAQIPKSRQEYY